MEFAAFEPSPAKTGTLALVFAKIVWTADRALLAALQSEKIVGPFSYVARDLNTKVLAVPWLVPPSAAEAERQRAALRAHAELREAHGFAIPELSKRYLDDDGKKAPYLDGGELCVAMARAMPERLHEAMPYLRAPQRPDWFMDALVEVAAETKNAAHRGRIYDAIAGMPVPSASNKHHKTYVSALHEGAAAYRAAKDATNAERLEKKAAMFGKKK